MNPVRVAAAAAAVLTALLLQATVIGPVTHSVMVSLPAVLVALVALREGPGAGLSLGFACGLLADLGSHHPAGLLALCWTILGAACGAARDPHRRTAAHLALAATAATLAGLLATVVSLATGAAAATPIAALVAWPGDLVVAAVIWWPVRAVLRAQALRPPAAPVGPRSRTVAPRV